MVEQIREAIARAQRILVVSHIRPDGDAIGSLLGLGLPLRHAGKDVVLLVSDGLPGDMNFLPGSDTIVASTSGTFDLVISVDASEPERLGSAFLKQYGIPDINIDHHVTNSQFGSLNLVEPGSAATAQMIADNLAGFGLECTAEAAQALLTGMLTDTIGFRVRSVTPQTLRTAANLMEQGANLPHLYKQALLQRSFEAARYWGAGLSTLALEGKIVWAVLTLDDRAEAGYPGSDDADMINIMSGIKNAPIAVLFIEQADGKASAGPKVKVSWRAQDHTDVSAIAAQFGGGGHRAAAGAEVDGDLATVQRSVLEATSAAVGAASPLPHRI